MYVPNLRKLVGKRSSKDRTAERGIDKKKINIRDIILIIVVIPIVLFLYKGPSISIDRDNTHGICRLENSSILLNYDSGLNSFEIYNKGNGRIYRTEPVHSFTSDVRVLSGTRLVISLKEKDGDNGFSTLSVIELKDLSVIVTIKAKAEVPLKKPFIFPGAFSGEEEKQYLVIPHAEGLYIPASSYFELGNFEMWGHKATMPFTGMTDSRTGIMVTSASPCDTAVEFVRPEAGETGNYLMQLVHYPQKDSLGYDRTFFIDLIQNDGYNEMADIFRNYLERKQASTGPGEDNVLVTLKDKLKSNRNVDKLIGAVDFWLGPMDMKDKAIIDDLTSNGVRKALINFQYGWLVYADEKRPAVVQYAGDRGLLPGRYDCFPDIFDPADKSVYQRLRTDGLKESVIIDKDGGFQKGWSTYYKNRLIQGYRQNPSFSIKDADSYIRSDLKENNYLSRFEDVITSCELYEDYSKDHPMTRSQDMNLRQQLLNCISSSYQLVTGSEETTWWAIPVTHYSEGTMTIVPPKGSGEDWCTPIENPGELYEKYTVNPTVRIPLKSLVYHDCHVSGWYTGDGVSKIMKYWRTKDLLTVLYGAMDLVFPSNREFWEQYKERYLWSIKVTGWVFEKTGYERMERHDYLTEDRLVQMTEFSNKVKVIVNFSDKAYKYGTTSIPKEDFLITNGKWAYTSDGIIK